MANSIVIPGYRGKLDNRGRWGVLTLKELTRRKNRNGEWEKGKTFHDITVFERDMNFIEQYTEEGQFLTVIGELVVDVVEKDDGTKRKFYKILPRELCWAPKGESGGGQREKPKQEKNDIDNDDIPF